MVRITDYVPLESLNMFFVQQAEPRAVSTRQEEEFSEFLAGQTTVIRKVFNTWPISKTGSTSNLYTDLFVVKPPSVCFIQQNYSRHKRNYWQHCEVL